MRHLLRLSFILLSSLFVLESYAQTGQYDVRLVVSNMDCSGQTLCVDIEVQASSAATIFNLGSSNFRFSYSDGVINPVINTELAVSGITNTPSGISFYDPHNLTGTTVEYVSYNVPFGGGVGYDITESAWVGVGQVCFDIIDVDDCHQFVLHYPGVIFPPVVMAEVIAPLPVEATPGTFFHEGQDCDGPCNPFPVAVDDNEVTFEDTPISGDASPNDFDPDGETLTFTPTVVEDPENGTVIFNNDGTYVYTPTTGFSGLDSFLYEVCDPQIPPQCDSAYVFIDVLPCSSLANFTFTQDVCGLSGDFLANDLGLGATYSWNFGPGATPATATGIGPHSVSYPTDGAQNVSLMITTAACNSTTNQAVTLDPLLSNGNPNIQDISCFGEGDGSITISPTGGTAPYSYNWNNSLTTSSASGLNAGNYVIVITDANGCFAIVSTSISEPAALNVTTTLNQNSACDMPSTGSATANVSGGTTPYNFLWENGETTAIASMLNGGTHGITVTDASGCEATSSVAVTAPAAIVPSIIQTTAVSCSGASDGAAVSIVAGGTAPFSYLWDNGAMTFNVNGLTDGIHTLTVTDNNGCTGTAQFDFIPTSTLSLSFSGTGDISCLGNDDGTSTVTPANGTAPYGFLWDNLETSPTATALSAGNHSVTVFDSNGCSVSGSVTIGVSPLLSITTSLDADESCPGALDGSASVTTTNGVAPFTYLWDIGETTTSITGLAAGNYGITVFDSGGCSAVNSVTVGNATLLSVNASVNSNVTCNGGSDGSLSASVTNGTAPFTFLWSTGATTSTVTGLTASSYNVTVFDSNGCSNSDTESISEPGIILPNVTETTAISCNGSSDASATAAPTGGTAPYSFVWSQGETTASITGLAPLPYNVTITDSNGCAAVGSILINNPFPINAMITEDNGVTCTGLSDGQATASASGGTSPYSFVWDDSQTTATATGLSSGSHFVTVTDLNGCSNTASINISQNLPVLVTIIENQAISCNGLSDGRVTASPAGGTSPYTYLWDNNQTNISATGLDAGTHIVTVTDQVGCIATAQITLTEPTAITSTITVNSNVSCNGVSDGVATISTMGGSPPYSYNWDSGEVGTTASALNGGIHIVFVTDALNCSETVTVDITEPPLLVAFPFVVENVSCNGLSDGQIESGVFGGTTPYSYIWDNGETTFAASFLSEGLHEVTITDANNCSIIASTSLTEPAPLSLFTLEMAGTSCPGVSDGSGRVTVTGGTNPYTYLWDNGETNATATALSGGIRSVTVTDNNLCSATGTVDINVFTPLSTTLLSQTEVSCFGGSDGAVTINVTQGNPVYSFDWSGPSNGSLIEPNPGIVTIPNLFAGNYSITVSDMSTCPTSIFNITITEPGDLQASVAGTTPATCTSCDGTANLTITGGTSPFTYVWSNGSTDAVPTNLCSGTFDVTVIDQNGCTTSSNGNIGITSSLVVDALTTAPTSCFGGSDGTATLEISGGTYPYFYLWDSSIMDSDSIANNLMAGNYTVTILDSDGCTDVQNFSITEPTVISGMANTIQNNSCALDMDGVVSASATGGTPPYTYSWSPNTGNATTMTVSNLGVGAYQVTITDANGCTQNYSTNVTDPATLTMSIVENDPVTCFGDMDGVGTISANGGTLPYAYLWDNGVTDITASNLTGGMHSVTVTDANACFTTGFIDITVPPQIILTVTTDQNASCFGTSDGAVSAAVTGGSMPYTYTWSNTLTDATLTGITAGTYDITVTDDNGCEVTGSTIVTEPNAITSILTLANDVTCNGLSDGSASISSSGGSAPYTFLWDSGETNTTATNLSGGVNNVTITDSNNCSMIENINIVEPNLLTATITNSTNINCFGDNNGTADLNVAGGTPGYTILWDNGETNAMATNLGGGIQGVTVTDNNGCIATTSVNISEPISALTGVAIVVTDINCFGESNGSASITPTGGTTPYNFIWDNSETTSTATGLEAGVHIVSVTDANSCILTSSITITQPATALSITMNFINDVTCNGQSNGSASIATSGGTTPYTFLWDSGETTATATNLIGGINNVTVTDNNNCVMIESVNILEPTLLTATITNSTNIDCFGDTDGTADLSVAGGTPGYTILWDNGETNAMATNLGGGVQGVTVTDINGCTATTSVNINQPANALSGSALVVNNVSCFGESTGSATANISGGTLPYDYLWDNSETTSTATGLDAGIHVVSVTDTGGCTISASVTITQPASALVATTTLIQNVSCAGGTDGSAQVNISGGAAPYGLLWDNGISNPISTGLDAGVHSVVVSDAGGCVISTTITIAEPDPITVSIDLINNVTCFGASDGNLGSTVLGGTPPYTYLWNTSDTDSSLDNIPGGNYSLTVSDANGCSANNSMMITEPAGMLNLTVTALQDVSCFGGSDGAASVTANGGTAPYTYSWDNGETDALASQLDAGIHTITTTDANGCMEFGTAEILEPSMPISAGLSGMEPTCLGENSGFINIDSTRGGTPPYTYSLDGEIFTMDTIFNNLFEGSYTVYIQDANLCTFTEEIILPLPFELIVNVFAGETEIQLGESTTLEAYPNTLDTVTYSWLPVDGLSCADCPNPTAMPLETTTYVLTTTTLQGCTSEEEVTINVDTSRDVYIPNAFTPNDDGINDVFMIFSDPGVLQIRNFVVYDRWGELVFDAKNVQTNNPAFGWDGTFKGKRLQPAVFVYYAEVEFFDGLIIEYKGDVTLVK